MGRKVYTNEFKAEVCEYSNDNTYGQVHAKFGVSTRTIQTWRKSLGYPLLGTGVRKANMKDSDLKHEVCQYYENHTAEETLAKFDIGRPSLFKWRRELGYRNKSRGYNLYTEQLQPSLTKRERRNFVMTKTENGDLKAKVADLQYKLSAMELVVTQTLRGLGAEIESTLEAFDL